MSTAFLAQAVSSFDNLIRIPEAGIDTGRYIGLDRNERVSPMPDWFIEQILNQDNLHLRESSAGTGAVLASAEVSS